MELLPAPAPGRTTSEHRLTLVVAGLGTALFLATEAFDAFTSATAEGRPWAAALVIALAAAAAAYAHSRGRVKAAHEDAKAKALQALATMSPEEKARVLEALAKG